MVRRTDSYAVPLSLGKRIVYGGLFFLVGLLIALVAATKTSEILTTRVTWFVFGLFFSLMGVAIILWGQEQVSVRFTEDDSA